MFTVLVSLFLATAARADAQPIGAGNGSTAQPTTTVPRPAASRTEAPSPGSQPSATNTKVPTRKEPSTARLAAAGCTLGGALLGGLVAVSSLGNRSSATAGFLVLDLTLSIGPSCGHFYAGEIKHGLLTSLLRFVSYGLGEYLIINAVINNVEYPQNPAAASSERMLLGVALVGIGVGLSIYDIVDAGPAATRANERSGLISLRPVPLLAPQGAGTVAGLALAGRF